MKKEELLTKLKDAYASIEKIRHTKKSDFAYREATQIGSNLKYLTESKNVLKSIKLLDKYSSKGSDKSKSAIIEEFKSETAFDLRTLIGSLERSGNPPIED